MTKENEVLTNEIKTNLTNQSLRDAMGCAFGAGVGGVMSISSLVLAFEAVSDIKSCVALAIASTAFGAGTVYMARLSQRNLKTAHTLEKLSLGKPL